MHELDQPLSEFKADVERVEHLLSLIKVFKDFGASIPPAVSTSDPWPSATALHLASGRSRTAIPLISGSLQLYLAGRFEYCICEVVKAIAEYIASRATKYSDLPEKLRSSLKTKTLEVAQNPGRFRYTVSDSEALLVRLTESINTTTAPVPLASEVISITDSNMGDKMLADILSRVGISEFWKDLGKQAEIKLLLQKSTEHEATSAAQAKLNSIMAERNQVAHPTSSTVFPDADKVLESARFLKAVATTTVMLAKVYLASWAPPKV
ncbi:MAG: HEPN domain-containing protein [Magnetospirillum sp.]|nr:HEPN domain-containing protein [Magnetospirillum sp.]